MDKDNIIIGAIGAISLFIGGSLGTYFVQTLIEAAKSGSYITVFITGIVLYFGGFFLTVFFLIVGGWLLLMAIFD